MMEHSILKSVGMFWPSYLLHVLTLLLSLNSLGLDSAPVTTSSGNQTDRLALLAFRAKINVDAFTQLSAWNDSLHYCEWGGVTCSRRHRDRVTILKLERQYLEGTLSSHIGNLTFLRKIILTNNYFHGPIPKELGLLFRLRVLSLNQNSFSGSIPLSLSNLSSLTNLSLAHNDLEGGIPYDLCHIPNLESFQADSNHLTGGIPSCLHSLSRIKVFTVAFNQLDGNLPLDIGSTHLQVLDLSVNKFSGIIPESLTNASRLESIRFGFNRFTGSVPRDLGKLLHLRELSLRSNRLGTRLGDDWSFISSLTNCSKLKLLLINDNHLIGPLPTSIANLSTQLLSLFVQRNKIYGSIPIDIGNLVNLERLDASHNYLAGSIPTGIGKLKILNTFLLSHNRIAGPIPTSLGNLTLLTWFDLSKNELHGSIPPRLGNCQYLTQLALSYNKLNGTLPKQVMGIPSLVHLHLSHNSLSGAIPKTSEDISSFISELDLSSNKLSGTIPDYLKSFNLLVYLNLSYNDLEGPVPIGGIFVDVSAISVLGNNKLCGGVTELKLQQCPVPMKAIRKKGKSLALKVVVPVIVVSLLFVLLICFLRMLYGRRMQKNEPSLLPSLRSHQYPRVSYAEVRNATIGFSANTLVGAGRYGTVYRGFLEQFDTMVAVKVLNLQERGASKSFLAECNALRHVRHRNLVKIVTCCSSVDFQGNDFKALVYEFIPNGSLEEWIHQGRAQQHELKSVNFLQRLSIAIDVASALDYLHHHCQSSVVHCDLKPSNILLDDKMIAHLSDFGLAKVFSAISSYNASDSHGSTTVIRGSIGYIAPEYGMGGLVSIKGDVYSYGILLLEMFTGKRPTDDMFQDERNLHSYAKMALPEQVMNIVDQTMLDGSINIINQSDRQIRLKDCVVSVITLGVKCSVESPMKRLNMGEVLTELHRIKEYHQGVRVCLE